MHKINAKEKVEIGTLNVGDYFTFDSNNDCGGCLVIDPNVLNLSKLGSMYVDTICYYDMYSGIVELIGSKQPVFKLKVVERLTVSKIVNGHTSIVNRLYVRDMFELNKRKYIKVSTYCIDFKCGDGVILVLDLELDKLVYVDETALTSTLQVIRVMELELA